MSLIVETDTGTGANLTSALALGEFVAPRDMLVAVSGRLSNLNGAAATLTIYLRHRSAADALIGDDVRFSDAKRNAAGTTYRFEFLPILIKAGEKLAPVVLSSNPSDTNATWSIDYLDATPAQHTPGTPLSVVDDGAISSPTTQQVFGVADYSAFRVGDVLRVGAELMLVYSIDFIAGQILVVRSHRGSPAHSLQDGDELRLMWREIPIIGNPAGTPAFIDTSLGVSPAAIAAAEVAVTPANPVNATSITVTNGSALRAGDVVIVPGLAELIRVESIAGDVLTVTRQYRASGVGAVAEGDALWVVARGDHLPASPAAQPKLDELHDNRLTAPRAAALDNVLQKGTQYRYTQADGLTQDVTIDDVP